MTWLDIGKTSVFMLVAFAVDIVLWTLVGLVVGRIGKRWWPTRFPDIRTTMFVFCVIGIMVTMLTFPFWRIYPH
ncbi:hypothetical protein [Devosia sediminis]|uniref:Uncharacterized protein n=1 Tax=Devosia sediminis TaxID=2798801 RepID=A0A934INK0_9HYPH|nr:hypothetical protein [Devosia sediminis]MBJ3784014.1 hypothetical protein [Devosia sediminis]